MRRLRLSVKREGFFLDEGPRLSGTVFCEPISIDSRWLEHLETSATYELTPVKFKTWYPRKTFGAHKGDFGKVLIIAGSPEKSGAAVLAALGALRIGAGLVTVAVPGSCHTIVKRQLVEAMSESLPDVDGCLTIEALPKIETLLNQNDVCIAGPGLSPSKALSSIIEFIVEQTRLPLVLDADALNALGVKLHTINLKKFKPIVVTPHPGEMARVLDMTTQEIQASRMDVARSLSQNAHLMVLLKGAFSIIANTNGEVWMNPTGNSLLATGGMGDILSGMIGGLIAQKVDPLNALLMATFMHGQAADEIRRERAPRGVLAHELLDVLPTILKLHDLQM